jgi:hypothetical protein
MVDVVHESRLVDFQISQQFFIHLFCAYLPCWRDTEALVWVPEAFNAGYLLLAVRSAGANLVDRAIVQDRGIGVEETWLVEARKVAVGRIAGRVAV